MFQAALNYIVENAYGDCYDAQKWLDENYPKLLTLTRRKNITRLYVQSNRTNFRGEQKALIGSLDLSDFVNLEEIELNNNRLRLSNLNISNCPKLRLINDWTLSASISSVLDLTNNSNLEKLHLPRTSLTNLLFNDNHKLKSLRCSINENVDLNSLNSLNAKKLVFLGIGFFGGDESVKNLTPLSRFANLEELELGNIRFSSGHFSGGSLEPLWNLKKLKRLSIWTDSGFDLDLEYLPENLETIQCIGGQLAENLKKYRQSEHSSYYNFQTWRKDHQELIFKVQEIKELESILINLAIALTNSHAENETIAKALRVFIFQTEERIKELRKQPKEQVLQAQIEISPKQN